MAVGWPPTSMWQLKLGRNILAVEVPTEEQRFTAPQQNSQHRVLVPGRQEAIISGCKNQQRLFLGETEGFPGSYS